MLVGWVFFSPSEISRPVTCSGNCCCPSYMSSVGVSKAFLEVGSDQKPSLFPDAWNAFQAGYTVNYVQSVTKNNADCRASHLFTTGFVTKKFIHPDKSIPKPDLCVQDCSHAAGYAFWFPMPLCFLGCPCWSTVSLVSLTAYILPKTLLQNFSSQYALELTGLSESASKKEKPNMQLSKTGLINPFYMMGICVYRLITVSSNF